MEFYVARVVVCTTRAQPKDRPPARGSSINTHIHACCCPFITHSMARPRAGVCTVHHTHPTITHTSYSVHVFYEGRYGDWNGTTSETIHLHHLFPRRERERDKCSSVWPKLRLSALVRPYLLGIIIAISLNPHSPFHAKQLSRERTWESSCLSVPGPPVMPND